MLLLVLFCLYVERAPVIVEMLKDLEGGDVTVCRESMAELGIVLLIEGIPKSTTPLRKSFQMYHEV
jgi:hypothetical protein